MGLSQEAFADLAGLHRTYISALERGKRSIALDNVEKIASALDIDAYLLFIPPAKSEVPKHYEGNEKE